MRRAMRRVTRRAMRRERSGIARVRLLTFVVLVGIAAMVLIPKTADTRAQAVAARLDADLRKLWSAQDEYLKARASYASSLPELPDVHPSPGVVLSIGTVTASGWSAKATQEGPDPLTCAIFIGDVPAVAPAKVAGIIGCR
jgi:type II secretory pathway pseudopilin PulG